VNVYMDVTGQWVSGNVRNNINWKWDTLKTEPEKPVLQRWQVHRETEQQLSEDNDHSEWGTLHFTGPTVSYNLFNWMNMLTKCTGCEI